jgi:hypothetical protein
VALLVRHHATIVTMPIPLDLYEGTMPLITGIIANGDNPYTAPFQPQAADVYPPLYNILVAPLTLFFENDLVLHRAVSAVFILATCGLLGFTCWKQGRDPAHAAAAAAAVYAGLVFYSTPVASTNAPGVFLYALSIALPWLTRFSTRGLAAAGVCGLLAFYTKQYFILGVAIVCLYTVLYVSAARAIALGTCFLIALLTSLFIVDRTSPYFLDNTLFAGVIAIRSLRSWSMVTLQFREFLGTHGGYLLAGVLLAGRGMVQSGVPAIRWLPEGWSWQKPLLLPRPGYFTFAFMASTTAVVLTIGQNPGNFMTYLFQLMAPPLLVGMFGALARVQRSYVWGLPIILFGFHQQYTFLPRDFSYDAGNWDRIENLVQEADEVLSTQMLVMMLLSHGKPVYQDGHTFYFPLAAGKPGIFRQRGEHKDVQTVWAAYIEDLYDKVSRREFDLVIVSPWEMRGIFGRHPPPQGDLDGGAFLKSHYYLSETIPLSMTDRQGGGTWDLQVWKPRRAAE